MRIDTKYSIFCDMISNFFLNFLYCQSVFVYKDFFFDFWKLAKEIVFNFFFSYSRIAFQNDDCVFSIT